MLKEQFYVPWQDIDPNLTDGGIPGELAPYYVAPDLGDNPSSKNTDMIMIFNTTRDVVQSISMHPEAMKEGQPNRRIVEESLRGINAILERIIDVTHTDATNFFNWVHAIPPRLVFTQAPIRFPLRCSFANQFVHYGLGTLVETAELNRNCIHGGLDPQSADALIAPMYAWKAGVMKFYFDLEVAGEISRAELNELFEGKFRPGPIVSPPDADADRPDSAKTSEALSGKDVMQWYPTTEDWAVFAKLNQERYTPERIYQPEGAISTTEDVAFEQKFDSETQQPIIGGTTISQP